MWQGNKKQQQITTCVHVISNQHDAYNILISEKSVWVTGSVWFNLKHVLFLCKGFSLQTVVYGGVRRCWGWVGGISFGMCSMMFWDKTSGETRILKRCIKFHHFYLPFVGWHPLGFTEGFSLNGLFAGQTGDLCNSWSKIRTHIIKMIKHSFPFFSAAIF